MVDYNLSKRTCGGSLGDESLLGNKLKSLRPEEVLALAGEDIIAKFQQPSKVEEFLYRKHLSAVQDGLAALVGRNAASPADPCAIESVTIGPEGVEMVAVIRSNLETGKIKSCGGGGG